MLVQYLVGLCCLHSSPDAVDVVIGDAVDDAKAEKARDVDVTVTIGGPSSPTHLFKAYEVKREAKPLDVADVEQICIKLADMPTITHRAIVSTSGFSDSAKRKASRHGVTLYVLQEWTKPLQDQFPALRMHGNIDEHFRMRKALLCWKSHRLTINAATNIGQPVARDDDNVFHRACVRWCRHQHYAP